MGSIQQSLDGTVNGWWLARGRRKTVCARGAWFGPSGRPLNFSVGGRPHILSVRWRRTHTVPIPKAYAYFNSTICVPDQGRYVLKLLETGGPKPFVEELETLSTLGWG